jgi:hypothetical protein
MDTYCPLVTKGVAICLCIISMEYGDFGWDLRFLRLILHHVEQRHIDHSVHKRVGEIRVVLFSHLSLGEIILQFLRIHFEIRQASSIWSAIYIQYHKFEVSSIQDNGFCIRSKERNAERDIASCEY